MDTETHYTTLGLAPNALPEVVRALYKALALVYHPDKTLYLPPSERDSYAAIFRKVQEAFNVLSNSTLKAAYDDELLRHSSVAVDDFSRFPSRTSSRAKSDTSSTPQHRTTVKLTKPEEKAAMRAKASRQIEYLRTQRANRDVEEMDLDVGDLKSMIQVWKDLAEENKLDPPMHAHCAIRIHEYEHKIVECEKQREEGLSKLAESKHAPVTPRMKNEHPSATPAAPKKSVRRSTPSTTNKDSSRPRAHQASRTVPTPTRRAEDRMKVKAERAAEDAIRARARTQDKAQRDAAKQAQIDQKVAAVRAEKLKHKAKFEEKASMDAERIAKARAKAGVAPLGTVGAAGGVAVVSLQPVVSPHTDKVVAHRLEVDIFDMPQSGKASMKKICGKCSVEHATFGEWKKCNTQARMKAEDDDASSFQSV